jgi:hypothetical protein
MDCKISSTFAMWSSFILSEGSLCLNEKLLFHWDVHFVHI